MSKVTKVREVKQQWEKKGGKTQKPQIHFTTEI